MQQGQKKRVAILGATGLEGTGLGKYLGLRGYRGGGEHFEVILGSRSKERAETEVERLRQWFEDTVGSVPTITGETNADAARLGDVIFVTIPCSEEWELKAFFDPIRDLLDGKLVGSVLSPIRWVEGVATIVHLPLISPAVTMQYLLPKSSVFAMFAGRSHMELHSGERLVGIEFVLSDRVEVAEEASQLVDHLVTAFPMTPLTTAIPFEYGPWTIVNLPKEHRRRHPRFGLCGLSEHE